MVFDIRHQNERHKESRWVLDGHLTADPERISTYAGVVSRDSVRIALTYAAFNDLDVTAADIPNAYLQAPSSQQDYITLLRRICVMIIMHNEHKSQDLLCIHFSVHRTSLLGASPDLSAKRAE
jgi:hypothetical protein